MQYRVTLDTTKGEKYVATLTAHNLETAKVYADAYAAIEGHKMKDILIIESKGPLGKWYIDYTKTA